MIHSFRRALAIGLLIAGAATGFVLLAHDMRAYPHGLSSSLRAAPAPAAPGVPDGRRHAGAATLLRVHDALPTPRQPEGWSYPFACCSGWDCRRVAAADVFEGPDGYRIVGTGELVAYGDARLKDSPDGDFHWCSVAGASDGRTICLFVPPRGF